MLANVRARLGEPVDIASLAAFRVLFGALGFVSSVRFAANGWIDRFYVAPRFHFTYFGFELVQPLSGPAMHAIFALLALSSLLVMLGLFYRVAIVAFFVLFTYVELIDVATYLNHYYLLSLVGLLLAFMPANGAYSIDARLFAGQRRSEVAAWTLYALRLQVGLVYFFAGMAKLNADWLLHAQPLGIWLSSREDMFPLFREPLFAYAMSWGGFLFDSSIAFFLAHPRTRRVAYVVLIGFHATVGALFPIGMFPFIMIVAATVFFDASWPRRFVDIARAPHRASPVPRALVFALAAWFVVQIAVPLRAVAYDGPVAWHEQGMRFSWRVMVREKNGSVVFRVRARELAREKHVYPTRYLSRDQEREMSGQPDLVLQLAHRIARDYEARGYHDVEVRADALVSWNGRATAPMIDPETDLSRVADGMGRAAWILPAPQSAPLPVWTRADRRASR